MIFMLAESKFYMKGMENSEKISMSMLRVVAGITHIMFPQMKTADLFVRFVFGKMILSLLLIVSRATPIME